MAEAGHEILIIAPKYNRTKDHRAKGIQVKRYRSFSFSSNKNTHIAYPALIGIIRDLRDFKPDIIHVQTPMSIGVAGVMAARILDIPCIQTYHTYLPDFMVYLSPVRLFGFDKITMSIAGSKAWRAIFESEIVTDIEAVADDIEKVSGIEQALNRLLRRHRGRPGQTFNDRFAWEFTRFLYGRSNLVITPSRALARMLRRHRVKAPVLDVSNGIDCASIVPKQSYEISHHILNTGRLGAEGKNVDVIIRAFALAKKSHPELVLDISGEGPAEPMLRKLAKDLGVAESVNFLGFLPRAELLREYHKRDVFVTASTMETQGLVILEAMAAGLPVIGVDALAVPELVKNNRNGYLVKPGDVKSMAEAILKLTESPERNERFAQAGRKIAAKHDLPVCAERLIQAYEDVLSGRNLSRKNKLNL